MPQPLLQNLDDRRWADLVNEGVALIPPYAPDWTDHNISDPGRTLIDLFAWIAEMDIYQLNRVPDRHRRKFLAIIGLVPEPPRAAHTVLSFSLEAATPPAPLPATTEFEGDDPFGQPTRFRILKELSIVTLDLLAIQVKDQRGFKDLTPHWERREPISLFGENPQPGAALYLGFKQPLPVSVPVSLFFTFADLQSGEQERERLIAETRAQKEACRPAVSLNTCQEGKQPAANEEPEQTPPHHSVRTRWEFFAGADQWQPLEVGKGEVEDDTRSFTLNGHVRIKLPRSMKSTSIGSIKEPVYYLRCRLITGAYDAPARVQNLVVNGVLAEQAVPVGVLKWSIAKGAVVEGKEPLRGELASFRLAFNPQEEITHLMFGDEESPKFTILGYQKASDAVLGSLSIEAELLGYAPQQQWTLSEKPLQASSFRLFTIEQGNWRVWKLRPDFDASGRSDSHFLLDPTEGIVTFGDGDKGRVVPTGIPVVASYLATRAEVGNLAVGRVKKLADSPHNHAVLQTFDELTNNLVNSVPATGGAAAETLSHAEGRAVELLDSPNRAVTLADYESFAVETPGVRLAGVSAKANVHPAFPCYKAPGMIALIVLPYLPADRPMPSRGLLRAVTAYLTRRRVIGTRVQVVGPTYLELAIKAKVQACTGVNKADLMQQIIVAVNRFFHALEGGPGGTGWPFGRDVYRSEVLQVIDEAEGVDHVLSLELIANGGEPQCGNVCLGPTGLVAAGQHQIQVV